MYTLLIKLHCERSSQAGSLLPRCRAFQISTQKSSGLIVMQQQMVKNSNISFWPLWSLIDIQLLPNYFYLVEKVPSFDLVGHEYVKIN